MPDLQTRRVLDALLGGGERYGLDIGAEADLPSGTIHPILAHLEGLGWVSSRWEDVDPRAAGRPPRRYYRLTDAGREQAEAELSRSAQRSAVRMVRRPVGELS